MGSTEKHPLLQRFLKNLLAEASEVEAMFDQLVTEIKEVLPDFGQRLAMDSKAILSYSVYVEINMKKN